ncbi:class I SAM-dependent methyltransferase [Rhodococcus spelaei]|uniref:Class I SAM-dependent methyltransferase n=1 Tax=Rhodococcus spelaei TaxID=2546320 RepID=A0A541B8H9_9NOCA|nr:cyclopropane-fatty-acyl-phospholipid synthase family protein [Rhodococcus spelaei]TQF68616.1 class I SAM-dependent methyltransferase [Rhodococcus spelaei]
MKPAAPQVLSVFEAVAGSSLPVRVRCWDGSTAGPPSAPVAVVFRRRRALRRILWSPNELGLARAYVSGDLDVEGDLFALLDGPDVIEKVARKDLGALGRHAMARSATTFLRLGAFGPPPRPPALEVVRRRGAKHSKERDAAVVSHHYDVGNDFYRLILGPSMVYSCAYWARGEAGSLEDAQYDKLDLVCRKLGLRPGMRLLDVGCGWGSMAIHAARHYGVSVVGVTISHEQVDLARARVGEAGVADRVEIRLQDYRDVHDGPYDAISSIGMSEHVGDSQLNTYAADMMALLRPGGRLLNHAISSVAPLEDSAHSSPTFTDRYIFPDGELLPLSRVLDGLEHGGFEIRDCEGLREHYALTLRQWVANLQRSWDEAVRLVGSPRARTWLLYLTASALAFERGRIGVNQVLAVRQGERGVSGLPRTRGEWLGPDDSG